MESGCDKREPRIIHSPFRHHLGAHNSDGLNNQRQRNSSGGSEDSTSQYKIKLRGIEIGRAPGDSECLSQLRQKIEQQKKKKKENMGNGPVQTSYLNGLVDEKPVHYKPLTRKVAEGSHTPSYKGFSIASDVHQPKTNKLKTDSNHGSPTKRKIASHSDHGSINGAVPSHTGTPNSFITTSDWRRGQQMVNKELGPPSIDSDSEEKIVKTMDNVSKVKPKIDEDKIVPRTAPTSFKPRAAASQPPPNSTSQKDKNPKPTRDYDVKEVQAYLKRQKDERKRRTQEDLEKQKIKQEAIKKQLANLRRKQLEVAANKPNIQSDNTFSAAKKIRRLSPNPVRTGPRVSWGEDQVKELLAETSPRSDIIDPIQETEQHGFAPATASTPMKHRPNDHEDSQPPLREAAYTVPGSPPPPSHLSPFKFQEVWPTNSQMPQENSRRLAALQDSAMNLQSRLKEIFQPPEPQSRTSQQNPNNHNLRSSNFMESENFPGSSIEEMSQYLPRYTDPANYGSAVKQPSDDEDYSDSNTTSVPPPTRYARITGSSEMPKKKSLGFNDPNLPGSFTLPAKQRSNDPPGEKLLLFSHNRNGFGLFDNNPDNQNVSMDIDPPSYENKPKNRPPLIRLNGPKSLRFATEGKPTRPNKKVPSTMSSAKLRDIHHDPLRFINILRRSRHDKHRVSSGGDAPTPLEESKYEGDSFSSSHEDLSQMRIDPPLRFSADHPDDTIPEGDYLFTSTPRIRSSDVVDRIENRLGESLSNGHEPYYSDDFHDQHSTMENESRTPLPPDTGRTIPSKSDQMTFEDIDEDGIHPGVSYRAASRQESMDQHSHPNISFEQMARGGGDGRLSPRSLELKFMAELQYLESMETSMLQMTEVERLRAVSMAQQETVSLAQILKARQLNQSHEIQEVVLDTQKNEHSKAVAKMEELHQKQLLILSKLSKTKLRSLEESDSFSIQDSSTSRSRLSNRQSPIRGPVKAMSSISSNSDYKKNASLSGSYTDSSTLKDSERRSKDNSQSTTVDTDEEMESDHPKIDTTLTEDDFSRQEEIPLYKKKSELKQDRKKKDSQRKRNAPEFTRNEEKKVRPTLRKDEKVKADKNARNESAKHNKKEQKEKERPRRKVSPVRRLSDQDSDMPPPLNLGKGSKTTSVPDEEIEEDVVSGTSYSKSFVRQNSNASSIQEDIDPGSISESIDKDRSDRSISTVVSQESSTATSPRRSSTIADDYSYSRDSFDSSAKTSPPSSDSYNKRQSDSETNRVSSSIRIKKKLGSNDTSRLASSRHKRSSTERSDEEDSMSRNTETLSETSEIESKIRALKDELKKKKEFADKLKMKKNRVKHENLKQKEEVLQKQIEHYDKYIADIEKELDREENSVMNNSLDLDSSIIRPQIKSPRSNGATIKPLKVSKPAKEEESIRTATPTDKSSRRDDTSSKQDDYSSDTAMTSTSDTRSRTRRSSDPVTADDSRTQNIPTESEVNEVRELTPAPTSIATEIDEEFTPRTTNRVNKQLTFSEINEEYSASENETESSQGESLRRRKPKSKSKVAEEDADDLGLPKLDLGPKTSDVLSDMQQEAKKTNVKSDKEPIVELILPPSVKESLEDEPGVPPLSARTIHSEISDIPEDIAANMSDLDDQLKDEEKRSDSRLSMNSDKQYSEDFSEAGTMTPPIDKSESSASSDSTTTSSTKSRDKTPYSRSSSMTDPQKEKSLERAPSEIDEDIDMNSDSETATSDKSLSIKISNEPIVPLEPLESVANVKEEFPKTDKAEAIANSLFQSILEDSINNTFALKTVANTEGKSSPPKATTKKGESTKNLEESISEEITAQLEIRRQKRLALRKKEDDTPGLSDSSEDSSSKLASPLLMHGDAHAPSLSVKKGSNLLAGDKMPITITEKSPDKTDGNRKSEQSEQLRKQLHDKIAIGGDASEEEAALFKREEERKAEKLARREKIAQRKKELKEESARKKQEEKEKRLEERKKQIEREIELEEPEEEEGTTEEEVVEEEEDDDETLDDASKNLNKDMSLFDAPFDTEFPGVKEQLYSLVSGKPNFVEDVIKASVEYLWKNKNDKLREIHRPSGKESWHALVEVTQNPPDSLIRPGWEEGIYQEDKLFADDTRYLDRRMIFDLSCEVMMDIYENDKLEEEPFWVRPPFSVARPKYKLWRGVKCPDNLERLSQIVTSEVTSILRLGEKNLPVKRVSKLSQWTARKKRDRVDEILVFELREEESHWTTYTKDEFAVKMQLTESLMDSLLTDTTKSLAEAYAKKRNHSDSIGL